MTTENQNKLNELTCPILPNKPEGPPERREGVEINPFVLRFLCRRHRNADALDNQYGKLLSSTCKENSPHHESNKILNSCARDSQLLNYQSMNNWDEPMREP